jgi:Tol biopolymer transport system component
MNLGKTAPSALRSLRLGFAPALGALALLVLLPAANGASRHGGKLLVGIDVSQCSQDCWGLYTVNGDGSGLRALHLTPPGSTAPPGALAPDGRRIAYVEPRTGGRVTVRVGSVDGTQSRVTGRLRSSACCLLDWSPDSRRLVLAGSSRIWVLGAAPGSKARRIISGKPIIASVAWSPRGSRIAFLRQTSTSTAGRTYALYVVRPNGSGLQRVPIPPGKMDIGLGDRGFSWSPDDGRIVFSVVPSRPLYRKATIYSVNLSTRVSTRLGRGLHPLWGPRGRLIAFALPARPGALPSLYVSRPDGSRRKVLGKGDPAAWSPGGSQIATFTAGAWLVVIRANGAGKRPIVRLPTSHAEWVR